MLEAKLFSRRQLLSGSVALATASLLSGCITTESYSFNIKVIVTLDTPSGRIEKMGVTQVNYWKKEYGITTEMNGWRSSSVGESVVLEIPGNRSVAFVFADGGDGGSLPSKWVRLLLSSEETKSKILSISQFEKYWKFGRSVALTNKDMPRVLFFDDNARPESARLIGLDDVSKVTAGAYRVSGMQIQPTKELPILTEKRVYPWMSYPNGDDLSVIVNRTIIAGSHR